ncbi:MAG TPA: response regulator [Gemmatimonadaceae bacterium]|nr:response regulator [Gemmatimonadaceae bacterium]
MTPTGDADPKAAALQLLRERYRQTIAKTVDAFRQLATRLAATPAAPELLEDLRRELHRVRGSAGSYGYADASRLAEQVEARAVRWAADPALETEQRASIVAHLASALEVAFRLGDAADPDERPQRTILLLSPPDALLAAARTEGQLRGLRIAALDAAQCTVPVLDDIAPAVICLPAEEVERVGGIVWPRGIPMVVLDDGVHSTRAAHAGPAAGSHVTVIDPGEGAGAMLDAAERLLARHSVLGSTLLAVDDDPSILAMVRYFLEGPDLQVVTLDDPSRLRDALREVRPSLLLMDIQMPGHNGIELARAVRASPDTADLPIVLLSGETDPESRGRVHEAGADEFISKPIAPAQLRSRVAAQLDRRRQAQLNAGLHPATGLPLSERTHRALHEALARTRALGHEATLALVRPVARTTLGAETAGAPWLAESRRLARVLEAEGRVVGYHEAGELLVLLDGGVEHAGDTFRALAAARPATAPEWRVGVVSTGELPGADTDALVRAAVEAAETPVRGSGGAVHRWQRDEALVAPDVILVEDDASLSEMLQYALRASGFSFRAFSNGRVAFETLLELKTQGRRPFVLLDIDLPGMDGYSLHERLRIERPGDFSYVYITAHAAEPDQLRALRSGAVDFIAKPINLRILMAKMASWSDAMGRRG